MKKVFTTIFLLSFLFTKSYTQSTQTYFLGHSLINLEMPAMFHSLALDAGYTGNDYDYQIGIGANLWAQYSPPYSEQGVIYSTALPTGTYENFVFTEAVPLKNHITWSFTDEYADSLFTIAYSANSSIRTYLYETWHCNNSGLSGCDWDAEDHISWRTRLTEDLDDWMSIIDSLEIKNPGYTFYMIPGGQGMARLYDAIEANTVPGIDSVEQFFTDDIHLNDEGNYFIACIMFATLYGESPVGLTNQVYDEFNIAFPLIPTSRATRLQEIAWETVCNFPMSGVICTASMEEYNQVHFKYSALNGFVFPENYKGNLQILDLSGKLIHTEFVNDSFVPIELPNNGLYLASFVNSSGQKENLKFFYLNATK